MNIYICHLSLRQCMLDWRLKQSFSTIVLFCSGQFLSVDCNRRYFKIRTKIALTFVQCMMSINLKERREIIKELHWHNPARGFREVVTLCFYFSVSWCRSHFQNDCISAGIQTYKSKTKQTTQWQKARKTTKINSLQNKNSKLKPKQQCSEYK